MRILSESVRILSEAAVSTKVASAVATTTTTLGLGTFLDLIPSDIGKLATLVGIVLSSVLIFTHIRKGNIEYKKTMLEIELLERQKEQETNEKSD